MALFQVGIDVSRYQGSINWSAVAAAGKQFAIVRIGSSNNNGTYVDPYFLQNVNGAHAAGLRVGAYYYTYARTERAVAGELTTFLNALEGLQLEYPVFVDVEASSPTSLGKPQLTNLVKYAMDILNQRKWYAGLVQLHQLHQLVYECFRAGKLSALGGGLPLQPGVHRAVRHVAVFRFRHRQRHYRRGGSELQLSGLSAHDTRREF